MIICNFEVPKKIDIPKEILHWSKSNTTYSNNINLIMGADAWIACSHQWPHTDEHMYPGMLFLTLSIVSSHVFGQVIDKSVVEHCVPKGCLFVVDPLIPHWLMDSREDSSSAKNKPSRRWIGLQWYVKRDEVKQKAQHLVDEFSGKWHSDLENANKHWGN
jgi:hypothetical protein